MRRTSLPNWRSFSTASNTFLSSALIASPNVIPRDLISFRSFWLLLMTIDRFNVRAIFLVTMTLRSILTETMKLYAIDENSLGTAENKLMIKPETACRSQLCVLPGVMRTMYYLPVESAIGGCGSSQI